MDFALFSPTAYADVLSRDRVMDIGIRPLWPAMPRIAGPAYTVRCAPGDNLMLHAAIYRAAPGSIVVVEAGDVDYAVAGGNVCAIAQRHGIAAFVVDGVIRDIAEARERGFPVFARGVIPIPGVKQTLGSLNKAVHCGGVDVCPGDVVIADEEGIVVIESARAESVWEKTKAVAEDEEATSLDAWEHAHRSRVERTLTELGFSG